MVGDNAGAQVYVNSQIKNAEALGIDYQFQKLSDDTTESQLIAFIERLNSNPSVNGIIVQMPLPQQIDYKKISWYISPQKDIEGMHPENIGKILFGKTSLIPCTTQAVMELIHATGIDLYGKEVVIVGHSEIVGKPLSLLLLDEFSTVTVCHIGTSRAGKLQGHVSKAEVLVVAVGKAGLIKGEWVKEDSVIIDVGINRIGDKIVGDVEFEEAAKRASWITPVPGGVGPLTVIMLMRNLVEAARLQEKL
jgi:methylenetetrahydrofolate dehydrogenase (NADP+)/methenyltetrahydrofolate cyclohydrolase